MKLLLFTDNHWSTYSSSLRSRGKRFSTRLENQIETLNWVEKVAKEEECDSVICLGDFFDKPTLNDEEITALRKVNWNYEIPHYFLVGNHESSINDLTFNSTKILEDNNFKIISEESDWKINDNTVILFLPYMLDAGSYHLDKYATRKEGIKLIALSHNDLKGINYGAFLSQNGLDVKEIEKCCDLFINGHIHNGEWVVRDKVLNLGNTTGQNFSEDAFKYKHQVAILDTDNIANIKFIENPYAVNFYKLNIEKERDLELFGKLKQNAVLSIKCKEELIDKVKSKLEEFKDKILISRTILIKEVKESLNGDKVEEFTMDHISSFIAFCKEKIVSDKLDYELGEVCK